MILMGRLKFSIRVALELFEIHLVWGTVLRNPRRHFRKMRSGLCSAWNPVQITALSSSCCLIFFLVVSLHSPSSLLSVSSFPHSPSAISLLPFLLYQPSSYKSFETWPPWFGIIVLLESLPSELPDRPRSGQSWPSLLLLPWGQGWETK